MKLRIIKGRIAKFIKTFSFDTNQPNFFFNLFYIYNEPKILSYVQQTFRPLPNQVTKYPKLLTLRWRR